jgi:hypothetical protein
MRIKVQVRQAGVFQDMVIDPASKNMLGVECTAADVEYIAKRHILGGSPQRLLLGMMPRRIKTMVTSLSGQPVEYFADRTDGDWLAIELTPLDVLRFAKAEPGLGEVLRFYATQPNTSISLADRDKFMSNWPDPKSLLDLHFPDEGLGGAPRSMRGNDSQIAAFNLWVKDWPPVFHNSDRAPEAKILGPNGKALNG